jgi:hypothetical protein
VIKSIFWIQIVFSVLCEGVACFVNFFTRPFANFNVEQGTVEHIVSQRCQVFPDSLHYFISALYSGGQIFFYALFVASTALFFGGVIGLLKVQSAQVQIPT